MTKDSFLAVTEMEMRLSMFGKKKEEMMVYVIMGFLEAGKTSLIRDLLTDDMFDDKAKTLILACLPKCNFSGECLIQQMLCI